MIRVVAAICGVWLVVAQMGVCVADDGSPHHMTNPDGSLDMTKCALCHNEDLSLQRSKLETCTLCHAQTTHAGSDEHLRANPAAVKSKLGDAAQGSPAWPLAEDGHIYCGTCHLFHDPKVASENWLARGWLPPDSGLSEAVRQSVIDRWARLAATSGDNAAVGKFATKGTAQLRLPVDNGQLCQRCHGALR